MMGLLLSMCPHFVNLIPHEMMLDRQPSDPELKKQAQERERRRKKEVKGASNKAIERRRARQTLKRRIEKEEMQPKIAE